GNFCSHAENYRRSRGWGRDAAMKKHGTGWCRAEVFIFAGYWLPLPPLPPVPVVPLPVPLVFMLPVELLGSVMPVGCVVMGLPFTSAAPLPGSFRSPPGPAVSRADPVSVPCAAGGVGFLT